MLMRRINTAAVLEKIAPSAAPEVLPFVDAGAAVAVGVAAAAFVPVKADTTIASTAD